MSSPKNEEIDVLNKEESERMEENDRALKRILVLPRWTARLGVNGIISAAGFVSESLIMYIGAVVLYK